MTRRRLLGHDRRLQIERRGEEAVGVALGQLARVGEEERHLWIANLQPDERLAQPPGLDLRAASAHAADADEAGVILTFLQK